MIVVVVAVVVVVVAVVVVEDEVVEDGEAAVHEVVEVDVRVAAGIVGLVAGIAGLVVVDIVDFGYWSKVAVAVVPVAVDPTLLDIADFVDFEANLLLEVPFGVVEAEVDFPKRVVPAVVAVVVHPTAVVVGAVAVVVDSKEDCLLMATEPEPEVVHPKGGLVPDLVQHLDHLLHLLYLSFHRLIFPVL